MIEVEKPANVELDMQIPENLAAGEKEAIPPKRDPLLVAALTMAVGLAILVWGTAVIWGAGPVLAELPWFLPLISAFVSLITLIVGCLALGR